MKYSPLLGGCDVKVCFYMFGLRLNHLFCIFMKKSSNQHTAVFSASFSKTDHTLGTRAQSVPKVERFAFMVTLQNLFGTFWFRSHTVLSHSNPTVLYGSSGNEVYLYCVIIVFFLLEINNINNIRIRITFIHHQGYIFLIQTCRHATDK